MTTSDGASLWCAVQGSGPPVVLCHGGPGLWDYFESLAEALATSFTVHRWDQRGCGPSQASRVYDLDVALSDVQAVRRGFEVREPWTVVGHSWGAYLALLTALHHPESTRALVYLSGTGTPSWWRSVGSAHYQAERAGRLPVAMSQRREELHARERDWEEEIEYRRLSWMTDFAQPHAPPPDLERMATTPLAINRELNRALGDAELEPEAELLEACRRCAVPSLFLHGAEDPRRPDGARHVADQLPKARFVLVPGAGHFPWVERPQATVRELRAFLAEIGQ